MKKLFHWMKAHTRLLGGIAVCLAAFFVFAAVWLVAIRGQGGKSKGWAINDQFHSYQVMHQQLMQDFTCDRDLLALSLVLAAENPDQPPLGEITLTLQDAQTGQLLASSTGDMQYIYNGWEAYYTTLGLDKMVESTGQPQTYRLTLTPHYIGAGRLCVGYESGGMPAGVSLSVDGAPLDGTIALRGVQATVGGFLTQFYWVITLGCLVVLGLGWWGFTCKKLALHRLVFGLVLGLGLLYSLVLPPYAVPDEQFHINQSFTLASTIYNPHLPIAKSHIHDTLRRASDQDVLVQDANTTVFTWQRIAKELASRNTDPTGETTNFDGDYQVDSRYTLYWASGLGVLVGFWLHLGFVPTLFLGRLANLLVFAACSAWAVKKTPVAKPVFALAALLPISLHLGASFSRDSNLLALAFLFSALMLNLAFGGKEPLHWKQLLLPGLLGLLLAPSKVVYFPLVLLVLLIPRLRLGRYALWLKSGFVGLCLLVFLFSAGIGLTLQGFASGSGQAAAGASSSEAAPGQAPLETPTVQPSAASSPAQPSGAESADAGPGIPAVDQVCYTLPYILSHPLDTFKLCVNSVVQLGDHYAKTLVGGTLGYFAPGPSIDLAWVWVVALYLLLALAWLCPGGLSLPGWAKALGVLVGLACCGLAVLGCVSWTPTHYATIYGLQGRYFLPVLPLLLLACPKKLCLATDVSRGLVFALGAVNVCMLLNAFLVVAAR